MGRFEKVVERDKPRWDALAVALLGSGEVVNVHVIEAVIVQEDCFVVVATEGEFEVVKRRVSVTELMGREWVNVWIMLVLLTSFCVAEEFHVVCVSVLESHTEPVEVRVGAECDGFNVLVYDALSEGRAVSLLL